MVNRYIFRPYLYLNKDFLLINFDKFLNMLYNKINKCSPEIFRLTFTKRYIYDNDIIKIPDVSRYYKYLLTCDFVDIINNIFWNYNFNHFTPSIIKIFLDSEEFKKKCSIINHHLDFVGKYTKIYHDYNIEEKFILFKNLKNDITKKKYAFILASIDIDKNIENNEEGFHAIFLLVNNEKRRVNIIDPNGHSYIENSYIENVFDRIEDFFKVRLELNYHIEDEIESNPEMNFQGKFHETMIKNNKYKDNIDERGYCFFWVIFIFVTYMLNEEYYDGDIYNFQEDMIDILKSEDKNYIHGFALYCLDIIMRILFSFKNDLYDSLQYKNLELRDIYFRQNEFLNIFYKY